MTIVSFELQLLLARSIIELRRVLLFILLVMERRPIDWIMFKLALS